MSTNPTGSEIDPDAWDAKQDRYVWVLSKSISGGPEYDVIGVFISKEAALAFTGGSIHEEAGRQSFGGWKHPDGSVAWSEMDGGLLITEDMHIHRQKVLGNP